ncbi:hypothetical protein DL89DRAFT_64698 [Linderina pennispora]|uniref:Uncharacterized protein n=1 Tax=Linderina pennispora TaxID=61395 RepID=A0A1Y1VZ40_9FUNG|nr:uncharacterized protein DL89DRAFT_64698 [Linderina pennispora]ORX66538.1 hypothetical protein DL89DRAFT_64698 [Linderina pennispora]
MRRCHKHHRRQLIEASAPPSLPAAPEAMAASSAVPLCRSSPYDPTSGLHRRTANREQSAPTLVFLGAF